MSRPALGLLSLGDPCADPGTGRRPAPAERTRSILEDAELAERLGFDSVWLAGGGAGLAAPAVLLAAIAARTERVRLGATVDAAGTLDALRLAEDFATLDGISGGRIELAAGWDPAGDAGGFGRVRERVELVRRLWTESEVIWSGRFRAPLAGVTLEPRPVQQPHPPLWIAGGDARAADLAAELGLPLLLPGLLDPPARLAPLVARLRERAARAGGRARVAACLAVHVRSDSQEAREAWRPYWANFLRFHAPEAEPAGARLLAEAAACGSPAEVLDRIEARRETLGLEALHLAFDLGGLPAPVVRETIERFARDVAPHLAAPGAVG